MSFLKSGALSIKRDQINGERSEDRSWTKYMAVIRNGHLQCFKPSFDPEALREEYSSEQETSGSGKPGHAPILQIPLDAAFTIADKPYKDTKKKVLVLKLPDNSQFLITSLREEDLLSWVVALENAINELHETNVRKIERQLTAAIRWLDKMKEGSAPEGIIMTRDKAELEVKNLTAVLDQMNHARPKKSTSMTDLSATLRTDGRKGTGRARSNTARADSIYRAGQRAATTTAKNKVFTNELCEASNSSLSSKNSSSPTPSAESSKQSISSSKAGADPRSRSPLLQPQLSAPVFTLPSKATAPPSVIQMAPTTPRLVQLPPVSLSSAPVQTPPVQLQKLPSNHNLQMERTLSKSNLGVFSPVTADDLDRDEDEGGDYSPLGKLAAQVKVSDISALPLPTSMGPPQTKSSPPPPPFFAPPQVSSAPLPPLKAPIIAAGPKEAAPQIHFAQSSQKSTANFTEIPLPASMPGQQAPFPPPPSFQVAPNNNAPSLSVPRNLPPPNFPSPPGSPALLRNAALPATPVVIPPPSSVRPLSLSRLPSFSTPLNIQQK